MRTESKRRQNLNALCLLNRQHSRPERSAFVLILVLIVIMMLSFAVYSFSHRMLTEYTAEKYAVMQTQRRLLAESALDVVSVRALHEQFARPIPLTLPDGRQGTVEVFQSRETVSGPSVRGVINESSRVNLNALKVDTAHREETRQRLLSLPGMTPSLCDSLISWIANAEQVDAESGRLLQLGKEEPPRRQIGRVSDLLQVRGMTRALLWGEDQNQNGILDPEEDDGGARSPQDNRDGRLQFGLSRYFTVSSAESVYDRLGRRRIVLNQRNLATLFDEVRAEFGTTAALFIVGCRMNGATYSDALRPDQGDNLEQRRLERFETARSRMRAQLGLEESEEETASVTGAGQVRSGLTLTQSAVTFQSLIDLFGGHVRILIDGKDTVLDSPWASDAATLARELPVLQERFTLEHEAVIGRININEADESVLRTIPGISTSMARRVFQKQPKGMEKRPEYDSIAWLLTQGLLTPGEFRQIAPWITTGGDVYSGIAVGRLDSSLPAAAIQFRIDCTRTSPVVEFRRDLSEFPLQ